MKAQMNARDFMEEEAQTLAKKTQTFPKIQTKNGCKLVACMNAGHPSLPRHSRHRPHRLQDLGPKHIRAPNILSVAE